jgi:phosphatidyl-myo-inositol alpha-mannosyltransferase
MKRSLVISNYDDRQNPFYGGGGALAVHEVAKRLALEFDVTVITSLFPGSRNEYMDGVFYQRIGWFWLGPRVSQIWFSLLLPFYAAFKRCDLWIESFTPPFSVNYLPMFTKKPVIGLAHTLAASDAERKYGIPLPVLSFIEKTGLKLYSTIITVSGPLAEKIRNINKNAELAVIPNGVYLSGQKKPGKEDHILFMGRIEVDQKGLDILLKSYLGMDPGRRPKLIIAGSGSPLEMKKLSKLVLELKLSGFVELKRRVSGKTKEKLFLDALFCVIPSRFESFSITALEALSYGKAVVCFDIPGLSWLPKTCGLKVKNMSEEGFGNAMSLLSSDGELRRSLMKNAKLVAGNFNWDRITEKYLNIINKILGITTIREKERISVKISEIIKNNKTCYFISPHLDDALLSAGGLIAALAKKVPVKVITVFTKADDDQLRSLSVEKYLKSCGAKSARKLYLERREEDYLANESLGSKAVHLNFTDALWRRKASLSALLKILSRAFPILSQLYPSSRQLFSGRVSQEDFDLKSEISFQISRHIPNNKQCAVFCPAGIGGHVDHVLVREVCEELFDPVLWQDSPYFSRKGAKAASIPFERLKGVWEKNLNDKISALHYYQTQLKALLGGNMIRREEAYYLPLRKEQNPLIKPTVSVAIPAYNEEQNIKELVESVINQREDNFALKEILVIDDGSTDNTVVRAYSMMDERVRVVSDGKRKGKPSRLNQIFSMAKSDYLLLMDGDIKLSSAAVIKNLVYAVSSSPKVGLVSGLVVPKNGKNFLQSSVYLTWEAHDRFRTSFNQGNNVYSANGNIMALPRSVYKRITLPKNMFADDQYMYYRCISLGFEFKHVRSAKVYIELPDSLSDHIKQNTRFIANRFLIKEHFHDLVLKEHGHPKIWYYYALMTQALRKPIHALFIFIVNRYCSLSAKKNYSSMPVLWKVAVSTKKPADKSA